MRSFGYLWVLGLCATDLAAQDIPVPSGLPMTLFDVRLEQNPAIARFRFVSEAIDPAGAGKTFVDVVDDLQYLCDNVAVPSLAANNWTGGEVILSLSSAETPFGETAPEVTQFFQPYEIADEACIWGDF